MIAGDAPGGGFDTLARFVARHMGKYLPGNPNVIVENVPGASHRVATNRIYDARPDGLTMGIVDRYVPVYQLRGEGPGEGVRYDVTRLTWLGSVSTETQVLVLHQRAGVTSAAQLPGKEVKVGNTSPGGPPHSFGLVLNEGLGSKLTSVFGYVGGSGVRLGIDRGEVDGQIVSWSSIVRAKGDEIEAKVLLPIVFLGGTRPNHPLAQGVPLADDLFRDKPAAARQLLELAERPFDWSWPLLTAPNTDPRVAATMRAAFLAALADPEAQAEAQRSQIDIEPVPGERLQELVAEFLKTPKETVDRLAALVQADSPQ